MRILLLTTYFRPDVGANAAIMSKLADEFVAKGHQVTVLSSIPHYDSNRVWPEYAGKLVCSERADAMQVYRVYTHVAQKKDNVAQRLMSYASFSLLALLRGATLSKQDVMLVPSPPLSNGVIADLIGRLRGIPFVYNVQDIWPDVAVRAGVLKSPTAIQRLERMERYVYRRSAGITVISDGFRRNLLAKGVPDEKISVISNFVDVDFITPQPKENEFSRNQGLNDKFVVMFAGNMGFSQGLETVLDAAKLLDHVPSIEFLMVGNGASCSQAQTYLGELGLKNVRFLPFQPREDLPAMYGAADVCLVPLRRGFTAESVPSKVFTIMAAGRPAIAAVDPGSETWKLLERTNCGICVESENPRALADAVLCYYRDPQARLNAGLNARRCVETEFQPGEIAEQYLNAMKQASGQTRERDYQSSDPEHETNQSLN
ncbi:MAG TPA: glycosyltransferase family 4 protein [Terracidiphilus sp.]|jgi:colanic acid biosynthesis glycosyl transferase WcaI